MSREPRIVSLVPSLTETLFDLDLQGQLVGRTTFCIHPQKKLETIPSVGGTKAINMNKFKALNPTHVLVNVDENPKELADEIESLGVEVVVTHPLTPQDNLALFEQLGSLFDRREKAEKLGNELHSLLTEMVKNRIYLPSKKVLYLIWKNPWMTISRDTYISQMLDLVNWQTVGHNPQVRYPEITLDKELASSLDKILLSTEPFSFTEADATKIRNDFGENRAEVSLIDGEMTSWYGSRAIAGLKYLKQFSNRCVNPQVLATK